jgi:hypothetical protein
MARVIFDRIELAIKLCIEFFAKRSSALNPSAVHLYLMMEPFLERFTLYARQNLMEASNG